MKRRLSWNIAVAALALASCATSRGPGAGGLPMQEGLFEVRNISVSIRRPPREVHAFITSGENVPRWAKGLGTKIRRVDGEWIAEGPIGAVRVRFAPPNDLGVADHDVVLPSGEAVHNPIRVVPNGAGSTVIFTLLRRPGLSEREFEEDARAVRRDLASLKALLERP